MKGIVYLIWFPGIAEPLKIGKTWNLEVRLPKLNKQAGVKGRVIAYKETDCDDSAWCLENRLHYELRTILRRDKYREWYPMDTEVVQKFLSLPGVIIP